MAQFSTEVIVNFSVNLQHLCLEHQERHIYRSIRHVWQVENALYNGTLLGLNKGVSIKKLVNTDLVPHKWWLLSVK